MEAVQMTIFDFLAQPLIPTQKRLLNVGDTVYTVSRADIRKWKVIKEFTAENEPNNLRYTLQNYSGSNNFSVTSDAGIGIDTFTDLASAEEAAKKYMQHYKMIPKTQIGFAEAKCFSRIRACDNAELLMWYGILPKPVWLDTYELMVKDNMSYIHILCFDSESKMRKYLEKNFYANIKEYSYKELDSCEKIIIPNMYPCSELTDWDYCEDGYSQIKDTLL